MGRGEKMPYSDRVKIRLCELHKSQRWLAAEVNDLTGANIQPDYLNAVINGRRGSRRIIGAINIILGLE